MFKMEKRVLSRMLHSIARHALLVLLAPWITGCAQEASPKPPLSLPGLVRDYAEQSEFSGTVLVRHGNQVLVHEAVGIADRAFGVPTAPDTRYRIASITKLFTATLILQLADEGRKPLPWWASPAPARA